MKSTITREAFANGRVRQQRACNRKATDSGKFVPSQLRMPTNCWLSRLRPRTLHAPRPRIFESAPGQSSRLCRRQSSDSISTSIKWQTLIHNGPLFAAAYVPLPNDVHFYYGNCAIQLSERAEEAATLYAKLLKTDFVQQHRFNDNFFKDFRRCMNESERYRIRNFALCNFDAIHKHLERQTTQQPHSAGELERHSYCFIDGRRLRVKNYRLESPALQCPRNGKSVGSCLGMIRPRVQPEDMTVNCSDLAMAPSPPAGHHWKQLLHDPSLSWLCSWYDVETRRMKYMYAKLEWPSARREHFETARRLLQRVDQIRRQYRLEWSSEHWLERQRGVALYCIDRLAMRADASEEPSAPDTVALCELRVEQLKLQERLRRQRNVVQLRQEPYHKIFAVEPEILYSLSTFVCGKQDGDLVFEELTGPLIGAHLDSLMDGLTPQIFRSCNASLLLEQRLEQLPVEAPLVQQLLHYNIVLREIQSYCSHRSDGTDTLTLSLADLNRLINRKRSVLEYSRSRSHTELTLTKLRNEIKVLEQRKMNAIIRNSVRLIRATLVHLDPRITVAWCQRRQVPIEAIYNSSILRTKLAWALQGTNNNFRF